MKTIQQVKDQIAAIQEEHKETRLFKEHELKKAGTRCRKLRDIIYYLETNPSEEFIWQEVQTLKEKIARIEEGYNSWLSFLPSSHTIENPEAKYRSEMGLATLKNQLKNLTYILE